MKKLLLIVAISVAVLASCGKSAPSTLDKATTFTDSINIGLGQYLGALANKEFTQSPQLNKDEVREGLLYVMATDTADFSRFLGIDMGLNLFYYFYQDSEENELDIDDFLAGFEKVFTGDSIAEPHSEAADSLSGALGAQYGVIGRNELNNHQPGTVDPIVAMEQIRTICLTDSSRRSYLSGITMGIIVYNYYRDQSARVGGGSREQFIDAMTRTFDSEPVTDAKLAELKATLDPMTERSLVMLQERMEQEIYDSREAKENRILSDAVAAKLIGNPEFSAVGEKGLMMRTVVPGNGKMLNPQDEVRVDVTARRIDSRAEVYSRLDVRVIVGNPLDPVLMNILPLMQMGETAEFFVPYELAYGTLGMKRREIGPCESLLVTVSVKPV